MNIHQYKKELKSLLVEEKVDKVKVDKNGNSKTVKETIFHPGVYVISFKFLRK